MGNLVSSKGLKPDPKKVEAIINMQIAYRRTLPPAFNGHDKVFGPVHSERIRYYGATPSSAQERSGVELDVRARFRNEQTARSSNERAGSHILRRDKAGNDPGRRITVRLGSMTAPGWKSNSLRFSFDDFCGKNYAQIEKEMLAISLPRRNFTSIFTASRAFMYKPITNRWKAS